VDLAEHSRRTAELARQARPRKPISRKVREEFSGLASLGVVLTVVWVISGGGYFWPAWPLGIIGAMMLAGMIQAWGKR
jgi:hypothetical protein